MLRAHDLLGLPVKDVCSGKEWGVVQDVLFQPLSEGAASEQAFGSVRAFIVESKGLVRHKWRLDPEQVSSYQEDGVWVKGELQDLLDAAHEGAVSLTTGPDKLLGRAVYTAEGKELGDVQDVYFQEEVGTLIGYELSGGFIEDMRHGRKWLKAQVGWLSQEKEALIVPDESAVENEQPEG